MKLVYAVLNKTLCFSWISLDLSNLVQVQLQLWGTQGHQQPPCPFPAPSGSLYPATAQDPISAARDHQTLPQWRRSSAGLQFPTALPCLPTGHIPAWPWPTPAPVSARCPGLGLPLMPPGLSGSLDGTVGWAPLSPMGSHHHTWCCCPLLCPDNYLVFILLTCQRCVIRCKIKMKHCRESMRCVLAAALPLPCISFFPLQWFNSSFVSSTFSQNPVGWVLEGIRPCCLPFLLSGLHTQ